MENFVYSSYSIEDAYLVANLLIKSIENHENPMSQKKREIRICADLLSRIEDVERKAKGE